MEEKFQTVQTKEYSVVGKSLPRVDAAVKATGQAKYTEDIALPQMLYGKILRSPYHHARIVNIDTSQAEKLSGVEAIITGKDLVGVRYGMSDGLPPDEYPLSIDKVRYQGDGVAAVVAIDEEVAEAALDLIRVDYEILPPIFDPEEALKEGAPQVHDGTIPSPEMVWDEAGLGRKPAPYKVLNNTCATFIRAHGDAEKGFRESDYIREDRFIIPATAHCAIEPHAALASFDSSGSLQVWLSHMGYEVKRQWLAHTLGMPLNKVRVLKTYVGGAFGGKIYLFSYEFLAAFLSRLTGRPVRIALSREEVFLATPGDQRMTIELKTGVKKDGTLVAQHMKLINDAGAYRGSSLIALRLAYSKTIPVYNIPNVKVEGVSVYTNKTPCGPKRGHGTAQVVFAIESQLDMIAEDLGVDAIELRLKNARKHGDTLPNGDRLASCGLRECIEKATRSAGWGGAHSKQDNRGIGIGVCAAQSGVNVYPHGSSAIVRINSDGSATLFTGAVETGQGSDTVMCQIVAEELGLSLGDIVLVSADSELCPADLGNFLMGGVFVTGEAVRLAAADAKRQLLEDASRAFEVRAEELETRNKAIYLKGSGERRASFSDVLSISQKERGVITGKGYRKAGPEIGLGYTYAYVFTAAVAEVEVDKETGIVKLLKVTIAHDGGFALNPLNTEGQIDGQVIMGQGDLFFEEILLKDGQVVNPSFTDYVIPIALDATELKLIDVETVDPLGPFGAKQAGECARPPLFPAVANAVYNATGVRLKNFPITPDKILKALESQGGKA
ncbi:MAG: molybdopterin-dependent oxidoreductase [Desulfobacterales bacterium]|nr:molybdopterin-dependent oxidoreductase [Desulfobacterales bacterium]